MQRRTFLKTGSAVTFGLAALQTSTSKARILGANDRARLGFIGTANRGMQNLDAFAKHEDVEVAALCDVDKNVLERAAQVYERFKPYTTGDFRKIYDRDDIDGVVLSTPDHWHAIQTVDACKAGKDVYVEKPLSVTVYEGRKMVEAARKYERVVQVGIHRRSGTLYRKMAEENFDDKIGKVTVARCSHMSNMAPAGIGQVAPSAPPDYLDWDMWLGPRAERPYQENIAPYKFRWWLDYSSQVANNGVHSIDAIRWLLRESAPVAVCAMGGKFCVDDDRTIPDTMEVIYQFASGRLLIFNHYEANSNPIMATEPNNYYNALGFMEFRGINGTLYLHDTRYIVKPERPGQFQARGERMQEFVHEEGTGADRNFDITALHARNFVDCMKSRQKPHADVEDGHRSTTMSLIANISLAVEDRLKWDAENERFLSNDQANQMLHYEYRSPWKLEV